MRNLSKWWYDMDADTRALCIHRLRTGCDVCQMPDVWRFKPLEDRMAIINALRDEDSLSSAQWLRAVSPKRLQQVGKIAHETAQFDLYSRGSKYREQLDAKNRLGVQRLLPSGYASLTDEWVRGTSQVVKVADMNDGYLENSCKLVNESHGELVARCTSLLGRMAKHFRNVSDVTDLLEQLCLKMQLTDVSEVYPVIDALRQELHDRQSVEKSAETFGFVEDILSEWDRI